ncbi:MAG: hypothetical protein KDA89_18300 [Planctomycetaceae bacterium]|nr:hypothetical protein [Planctomycetaceae bacterium]
MMKRILMLTLLVAAATACTCSTVEAAPPGQPADWQRYYHYPYVYYPHSFQQPQTYNNMYHRYPQSMQIPVYNKAWYNFYPTAKPYHTGAHFNLDIF